MTFPAAIVPRTGRLETDANLATRALERPRCVVTELAERALLRALSLERQERLYDDDARFVLTDQGRRAIGSYP